MKILSVKATVARPGNEVPLEDQGIFRSTPYEHVETAEAQCFLISVGKRVYTQEARLFPALPSESISSLPNWMTVPRPKFE